MVNPPAPFNRPPPVEWDLLTPKQKSGYILGLIKARGEVSDEEWREFQKSLEELMKHSNDNSINRR